MPPRGTAPELVRVIEGKSGRVLVRSDLQIRFDYGHVVPWIAIEGREMHAIAGPDALRLRTSVALREQDGGVYSEFTVAEGEMITFVLTWFPSYVERPVAIDGFQAVENTERFWSDWAGGINYEGRWQDAVRRSLLTLKALTYEPSGGIVAVGTTSLPETLGGSRNWDYRYCWIRDASFTLEALLGVGLLEEARAWRQWILRAVAGDPANAQIMYGVDGTRRLPESELPWLSGREGAFLVCSFWLVEALHGIGRVREAEELFERLLELCNDVGLLSEEYDTRAKRLVGNMPQALSHLALVNCARRLSSNRRADAH
jgi:GH15 family glucan-1,4-alpha-glucosidase